MRVHVSIHDVAPPFRREVELALAMAHEIGVKPALLVVPDFHRASPLEDDPDFCAFLRGLQKTGHEIFLHGFSHRADASSEPGSSGLRRWFAQRVVSDGEAEMTGLSPEKAGKRLDAGETALREAGLQIDGFVAPAWSLPRGLVPVLAARRYAYTEDRLRIYVPAEGRSRASLVLNYASRTPARLYSSVAFCRAATPLAALVPARIAIHPGDMCSSTLRREVARLLSWGASHFVSRATELFA